MWTKELCHKKIVLKNIRLYNLAMTYRCHSSLLFWQKLIIVEKLNYFKQNNKNTMAYIQTQFLNFDAKIRLARFSENKTLREKRDKVLDKLESNFKNNFSENEIIPTYKTFDQGSYKMGTGIKPISGDFDIDVGIVIDVLKDQDTFTVKEWVRNALDGHTKCVKHFKPCVRVQYQIDDEPIYHVDLAVYVLDSSNGNDKMYLARGTNKDNSEWEDADPQGLMTLIQDKHSDKDKEQFKRIIRFLKRWKDNRFSSVHGKPTGIALTLCAYEWFYPHKNTVSLQYNDLKALKDLADSIVNKFDYVWDKDKNNWGYSITLNKPVAPYDNVFSKMSIIQMTNLRDELINLRDKLKNAIDEIDTHEACKIVWEALGKDNDFEVPAKVETAKKTNAPILTSASSA